MGSASPPITQRMLGNDLYRLPTYRPQANIWASVAALGAAVSATLLVSNTLNVERKSRERLFVDGESTYYLGINRNKRSIVLDLATPRGQDIVRRLVSTSDVVAGD